MSVPNKSGSQFRRSRRYRNNEQSEISPPSKSFYRKEKNRTLPLSKDKSGIQQKLHSACERLSKQKPVDDLVDLLGPLFNLD